MAGRLVEFFGDLRRTEGSHLAQETGSRLQQGQGQRAGRAFAQAHVELQQRAGREAVEHGGDINGFSGATLRFPAEGYYIAVLVNNDTQQPDTQTLAENIAALILP